MVHLRKITYCTVIEAEGGIVEGAVYEGAIVGEGSHHRLFWGGVLGEIDVLQCFLCHPVNQN